MEYYEETKYPLAVKLGTINSEGAGKFALISLFIIIYSTIQFDLFYQSSSMFSKEYNFVFNGILDVYSYDEDDMVEDPRIKEHLAHFGINIENMEKVTMIFWLIVGYNTFAKSFVFIKGRENKDKFIYK